MADQRATPNARGWTLTHRDRPPRSGFGGVRCGLAAGVAAAVEAITA